MSHHLKAVAAMPRWNGGLRVEDLKQLLGVSVLTMAVIGCGSPATRDVLAYDACVARHPQEPALCEGPRQAYDLDPTAFQARAAAVSPSANSSYEERSAVAQPALTPVPPRPSRSISAEIE
jgi:hypothetical protein